jgi:hypothetical protein
MLDRLRTPLFIIAVVAAALALGAEIGVKMIPALGSAVPGSNARELRREAMEQLRKEGGLEDDEKKELVDDMVRQANSGKKPPGVGVPSLGLIDGLLLYTLVLMGLGLLVPERIHGRIQGIASLIVSILILIAAIVLIIGTFVKVLIMIALFLAAPFGTLAYLAVYGSFNRGGAAAVLSLSMLFKLAGAVLLVLAHQRFLQNKGLVLLIATSLVANIIVSFLHGLVPIVLVSITDGVAAIIVGILAVIWAIVLLVGSIIAIVKAVL